MAAAPDTLQPVSPWTAIQEFAKNVVTLAGALIGLTVTFAAQLLGRTDFATRISLYAAWATAVLAIASGLASNGFVVAYLKDGTRKSGAIACANVSFFMLFFAAVSFAAFGFFAVSRPAPLTALTIAEKAKVSAPTFLSVQNSQWLISTVLYNRGTDTFDVYLFNDKSPKRLRLTVTSAGEIVSAEVN
jgi:hypothetical protein